MGNANAAGNSSSMSEEWSGLVRRARMLTGQGENLIALFPSKNFSPSLGTVDDHHSKMVSLLADMKIKLKKEGILDDSKVKDMVEKMENVIRELDSYKLRKAVKDNEKLKAGSADFEIEAIGLKAAIVKIETAIRLVKTNDAFFNELKKASNVYTDYATKKRNQWKSPAERLSSLKRGLKAYRTRVKTLEAKLAIAAPDESKWFATYPTVMKLINWRRGHVEGNVMPHMGELEAERSVKDLEGVQDPKARMTKAWIQVLKKTIKATKYIDQYFKDGILRNPDGTLMVLKPDAEARVHKVLTSTGRSKMVENCKLVDQATAQMMENGELQEDNEELLSLLRETREWHKMAVNGISTSQEAILVPSASSKSATADTENKDLCSPAAAGVPAASAAGASAAGASAAGASAPAAPAAPAASVPSPPYVPSLSFDDIGENSLIRDLPVVEATQVDVDVLEALLPIAPCGPIISPSEEQEVAENEGKESPVAC